MLKTALRYIRKSGNILRKVYRAYKRMFPKRIGMGIDLGVKDLATLSDGTVYPSINKSKKVMDLKHEYNVLFGNHRYLKARKIYKEIESIRFNYINEVIKDIIKSKPKYITIEDLHFNLSKKSCENNSLLAAIKDQHFEYFKKKLISMCRWHGIQLRQVPNNYPSSKICSRCGNVKYDLTLSDRTYICPRCSLCIGRDENAAINLMQAKNYKRLV